MSVRVKDSSFYCLFTTPVFSQGTKLWIIMEYLGGGSALDLVRRLFFPPAAYRV